MKKYFFHALFSLKQETYLTLIVFLGPCFYFLSGTNIDIYSPSMPTIATYFHASIVATKNTISISLLGWALGGFAFGILIDSIGRKKVLMIGMFFYVLSSLLAPLSHSIHELMLIRFIQGFAISSVVGARVLIIDLISGRRYPIAMLYTSIGYGLGPIVGPFVGGLLQHFIGWRANFYVLALMGFVLLSLIFIFIKESIVVRHPLKFTNIMKRCFSVLSHKKFMAGVAIGGITQIQLMLYATLGPFIVEDLLHQTVLVYGNSALIVGGAYLVGNLINRGLLKNFSPKQICYVGFIFLISGLLIAFLFTAISTLEISTIMVPVILTCMSAGFIFPNVLSANLKQFEHAPGIAVAVQSGVLLLLTSIGLFLISHVHVGDLLQIAMILLVLAILEIAIFFGFYRGTFLSNEEIKAGEEI